MNEMKDFEMDSVQSQSDASNTDTQSGERMFTQEQVEAIIAERLKRERKNNRSLNGVRQLLKQASQKGVIEGESYASLAEDFVRRLKETRSCTDGTSESVCSQAEDTLSVADGDGEVQTAKTEAENKKALSEAEIAEMRATSENLSDGQTAVSEENTDTDGSVRKNGEGFLETLVRLKEKYPDSIGELISGNLFESFAKGRHDSIEQIFDDFVCFMELADGKKERESEDRGYFSTAFSGLSGTASDSANLTKQQMEIAKNAGMSYREYANLLSQIPKKGTRSF